MSLLQMCKYWPMLCTDTVMNSIGSVYLIYLYELHLTAGDAGAWSVMNPHREKGEVRGRFQLKACEKEIRTERIKES